MKLLVAGYLFLCRHKGPECLSAFKMARPSDGPDVVYAPHKGDRDSRDNVGGLVVGLIDVKHIDAVILKAHLASMQLDVD